MWEVLKILYEWREGTTKRRMLSLVPFISHKAVKIPFFCVFLLIWPSVPGSGNRKRIPCIYHGLRLPAFGAGSFWGVSHSRAMRMSRHCSSRPLKEVIQTKILSQLDFLLYWISVNCYILVADNKEWLFHYSRTVTHLLLSIISIQELLLMNLYFWFSYISFQRLKSDCLP